MLHRLARRSILPKPYHIFCEINKVVKKFRFHTEFKKYFWGKNALGFLINFDKPDY